MTLVRRCGIGAVLGLAIASSHAYGDEPAVPPSPSKPPPDPSPSPAPALAPPPASAPSVRKADDTPPAFPPFSTARLALELELTAQGVWTRPSAGDDLSQFELDRGEAGMRAALGDEVAAEVRVEAIRSGVEGGALGIDGDSTILRVKRANVTGGHAFDQLRLDGALGFAGDPWIDALERDDTVKPLSRTGSERFLLWPTSDLALLGRAAYGPVRLSIMVGNGEGPRFPERNQGKTTTAVLEAVTVNTPDIQLRVAAVGRDGSIGPALVREHRYGGGATVVTPWARGGVEVVRALGIGNDGAATGVLASGWAEGRVIDRVFVAARGASFGFDGGTGRVSTFGGAIAFEPWRAPVNGRGNVRIWLAVDRQTSSGTGMPLAAADAGDATSVLLIASTIAPFVIP